MRKSGRRIWSATVTGEPIKQRYYPLSPIMRKQVNAELDQMLKYDIIEPLKSPWSSPIVMVSKKDNRYSFCTDYSRLNAVTERDAYPFPYIASI